MINVRAEQLKVLASANEEEFITRMVAAAKPRGLRRPAAAGPPADPSSARGPFELLPRGSPLLALRLAQRARHQQPDPLGEIAHRRIGELRVEPRMVILPPLQ